MKKKMVESGNNYKFEIEKQTSIRAKGGQVMVIEKANKADLQEILDLQFLAYQSEAQLLNNFDIPPLKQTITEIEAELSEGIILKVLDEENNIVGSVRGKVNGGTLYVGKLMVRPDRQGQGIGTILLKEIERICPQERYELFTSSKSQRNIQLYERSGYRVFTEKTISDNLSFVYLEKLYESQRKTRLNDKSTRPV